MVKRHFALNSYVLLAAAWSLLISTLVVLKVAPAGLNADILMNTIMSLQKVTVFYWGQDRLLNALPAATTWIRNPVVNLAANLLISSLTLFSLLYLASRFSAVIVGASNVSAISLQTFVFVSLAFVVTFKPHGLSEITIGHIEYSLPALLVGLAMYLMTMRSAVPKLSWVVSALAIMLAVAVNPSTVIPVLFVLSGFYLYRKTLTAGEVALGAAAIIVFATWSYVSIQYGSKRYHDFDPTRLPSGLDSVVNGLFGTLDLTALFLMIFLLSAFKVLSLACGSPADKPPPGLVAHLGFSVLLFSTGWLLLFSSSQWVEANQFSWRYFIYVIFAAIFLGAILVASILTTISVKGASVLTGVAAAVAVFAAFAPPVSFSQYDIFARVNAMTPSGSHLYSGNYWLVWPSVLRDMMDGHEAYGLTYRGHANKEAAREYVLEGIERDGRVSIYCLDDSSVSCMTQIASIVGLSHMAVLSTPLAGDRVYEIGLCLVDASCE